jgi:hypothetical protein
MIPRIYAYLAALLLLSLLAGSVALYIHHYGVTRFEAGRNDVLASDARASAQLQQQRDQLNTFSALATTTLNQNLGTQLPAIQAKTNDTIETIRTVYRDRPVADVACSRPASVQTSLDAAIDRANAAAGGQLRPNASTGPASARSSTP